MEFLYNLINIISYFSYAKCISSQWHQYTNLFYLTLHTQQLQNCISITTTNIMIIYLLKHVAFVFCSSFSPWCVSHKGYLEKVLCFKVIQNSFF